MLHAWVLGPIVITAIPVTRRRGRGRGPCRDPARDEEPVSGAAAGVAGFRALPVSEGIWRADLCAGPRGPVFHYHPKFETGDVGERYKDPGLSADPVGWTMTQLADVRKVMGQSGAADVADVVSQA
jgi:hypothetical protein